MFLDIATDSQHVTKTVRHSRCIERNLPLADLFHESKLSFVVDFNSQTTRILIIKFNHLQALFVLNYIMKPKIATNQSHSELKLQKLRLFREQTVRKNSQKFHRKLMKNSFRYSFDICSTVLYRNLCIHQKKKKNLRYDQ